MNIKDNSLFNSEKYFPEDEMHELKQFQYLLLMSACFTLIISTIIMGEQDSVYVLLFDFLLSIYCFLDLDKSTYLNKVIAFFLIPFSAEFLFIFDLHGLLILEFFHILVYIYMIRVYFKKFNEYTKFHGLGIAAILLFIVVFFSMYYTAFFEHVNLLDALVMTSNAFTSNGYAILGHSIMGKIDSIILVWSGYILSGVSTATLAAAILTRHFNKRFDELEEMIKNQNED